jgi:hypothetical protein
MSNPPDVTYLRTMTTEQAVDLLIALRHWIWEIHGDRIAPGCGYAHSRHDRISAVLNDR